MNIHLIAIGGAIMHSIAISLRKIGYQVSGSDDAIYDPAKSNLERAGLLPPKLGFYKERITEDLDAVILGMHAKENNVELDEAQKKNIPVYSFPAFIYKQCTQKKRVVIAGSHGKTTITAMVMHVLNTVGKKHDYLVGAKVAGYEDNVRITNDNPLVILEGDEYLSSCIDKRSKFYHYHPHIVLLSGIAWDHINVFPTEESYIHNFVAYIQSLEKDTILVYCDEDATVRTVVKKSNHKNVVPYSTPHYNVIDEQTCLLTDSGNVPLQIFGAHNMQNMEGARKICHLLGIQDDDFLNAFQHFSGADKRLNILYHSAKTTIIKDFAHSPSKVKASTKAVKEQFSKKQCVACLELHTYSSLHEAFLSQYNDALIDSDQTIIYLSSKAMQIKGKDDIPDDTLKACFGLPNIQIARNPAELDHIVSSINPDHTVFLFMSSGSFDGYNFEKLLNKNAQI